MEPNNQNIFNILYETRLIILLETGPQSNIYRQVMLTPVQFKIISDTIRKVIDPTPVELNRGFLMPIRENIEVEIKEEHSATYSPEIIGKLT